MYESGGYFKSPTEIWDMRSIIAVQVSRIPVTIDKEETEVSQQL